MSTKPADDKKLAAETAEAVEVATKAAAYLIESAADALDAQEVLKEVKTRYKALDDWRKEVVNPIKAGLKAFEDKVKPALTGWANAESSLKSALIRWDQAEKMRQLAAAQAAIEAVEAGKSAETVRQLVIQSATPPVTTQGVGIRSNWKARVTDKRALLQAALDGKTDEVYVTENQQALDAYAKATKGKGSVPGVEFYDAGTVSVRV